ncbi:uncharacterized protein LOC133927553 [Phragmites australis]|uniref:uncharacterized protein LOC133927553 n=1 Tax=Phragmites australis TaxID=29695 RepID=UPI002D76A218|nr:uncharacterized protein LOC133927553 [Phragmites australis]
MDCVVLAWLYGSISPELLQEVMSGTATARSVWRDLELLFHGNSERRIINLTAEFHAFSQGDLSIGDYCRRLKTMADTLADLGEPVADRTLVLQLIGGLSDRFDNLRSLLPMRSPFPTFTEARSLLLLDELTRGGTTQGMPATAFVATSAGPARPQATTASNATGSTNSSNNSRNCRRGRGGSGGSSSSTPAHGGGQGNSAQKTVWPTPYNPWTGSIQMWPGPMGHGPGLLGARPNYAGFTALSHAPFAGAAGAHFAGPSGFQAAAQPAFASQAGPAQYAAPPSMTPPTPHSVPTPAQYLWSGPSHWDPQVLASAYNTAVLTPLPSTEWYMDSGASAHMTSDAG